MTKPTLCIGDVHGHYDRLAYLLQRENIIDKNEERTNFDVEVVQLGDLGHFGKGGSPTGDMLCYEAAEDWFDRMLWGNHDYANINSSHAFKGHEKPGYAVQDLTKALRASGKLTIAHAAHGYLLTHAGLHSQFKHQKNVPVDKNDPEAVAKWLNELHESGEDDSNHAIWDAIGRKRNGRSPFGGILWRDASESLYKGFPQVFGHSRGDRIRKYGDGNPWSYCVDLGTEHNGRLGGVWLPEGRTVEVKI